jgi:hypothetical protein
VTPIFGGGLQLVGEQILMDNHQLCQALSPKDSHKSNSCSPLPHGAHSVTER